MKNFILSLAVFVSISMSLHGQIIIVDPFTDPDAVTYNFNNSFYGGGTPGAASDFGSVSGGTWSPSAPAAQNTDEFVVANSSINLTNIGDAVSLSIDLGGNQDVRAMGLVLSDNLDPSLTSNRSDVLLAQDSGGGFKFIGTASTGGDGNTSVQTGYSIMTITKTATDTYLASVSGGGISGFSQSFTQTGTTAYVGLGLFNNYGGLGGVTGQNFTLTSAVPEPSSIALLGLPLLAILFLARRKISL